MLLLTIKENSSPHQTCVERGKEREKPLVRLVVSFVRVAQPLEGADADGPVEGAGAEGEAVAEVRLQEVAVNLALTGNV